MSDSKRVRARPAIDKLLLIFVMACLGVALVRVATVATAASLAYNATQRQVAADRAAGIPATTTVLGLLRTSPIVLSWWGIRPVPYRINGTYIDVVSKHVPERTIGSVIGVIAEKDRKKGVPFKRIIVPSNRAQLSGGAVGLLITSADGTQDRTEWRPLASDIAAFSDVRVEKRRYNSVLTAEQSAVLTGTLRLVKRANDVYVGTPRTGASTASGTWVLLARTRAGTREYLLIPL